MRTIALEEHFVTESFLQATGAHGTRVHPRLAELLPKLLDMGAGRIAAMDEASIDLQILSLAGAGFDALEAATASALARDINDELAAAVQAHPVGWAASQCLRSRTPPRQPWNWSDVLAVLDFAVRSLMAQPVAAF